MDFTPELSAFQGVIISADNVHTFSRLTARGGNEDQIDYIIENMLRFLKQQNYLTENGTLVPDKIEKMRKFAFYIILNADLPALEQLVENDGIDSVIRTVPTIPKCLMSEILWKLHMEKFVYEAIAFSCPQLSLELASALIDYIKYFTPPDSIPKLKTITTALYKMVCRLHFFSFETDVLTNLQTTALNNLQKCLDNYVEHPQANKLVSLKKDALYKFKGLSLYLMFHAIYSCLEEFTGIQTFNPPNFSEIYQLTYKVGSYKEDSLNFATCNSPNKSILECLDKCNQMLLDQCKVLVMDISVDIFCAWSEFEEAGRSMQQTIGEFCYKLRSKLLNTNVISEHPVVNMIQQISRKPQDVQDEMDTADIETIVKNIESDDQKRAVWMRFLIQKDDILQDLWLLRILDSHIHILNEEESHTLYKTTQIYLNENFENIDKVKLLAIKAFQKCTVSTKYEIIEEHFKENCFTDSMECLEFNDMVTEIFNKVINEENADLTQILTVFVQNPQNVYTKIFNLSAESSQATDIMLRAMTLLEKYSNHYYAKDTEPCIVRIAETVLEGYLEKEVTQQNFIKFIGGLKSANVIPGTKLLLLIIMPKLHKALLDKDVARIHFQCKLLADTFTLDELMPYRAPMLAMIAQILEIVRWKITTFVVEGPNALDLALVLQKRLIDTYVDGIPANEENWLKSKLHKLDPLNCYYYRKLWNPPGNNFVEIVSGNTGDSDLDAQLLPWSAQVLCSTTQQEWCEIWDSLPELTEQQRLNSIFNALTVVTVTEAMNRTENNSWQCVLQCYRNLVFIIRYKFFKEPLTDEQVTIVIEKVSNLANLFQATATEAVATVFIPLFVYIVTKKSDYNVNVQNLLSNHLTNNVFKEAVNKVYSNGTT